MSEQHCEVDLTDACDDADVVEFVVTTDVERSRKTHECSECGEPIPQGSSYRRACYKFEGKMWCERFCVSCKESMDEFGWTMLGAGLFWESMREEWNQGANVQGCMNRLTTAAAKAHMLRQWKKWKGFPDE